MSIIVSCAHSLPPLELKRRARALFSNEATFAGKQYVCAVLPSLLTRHCCIHMYEFVLVVAVLAKVASHFSFALPLSLSDCSTLGVLIFYST